MDNNPPPPPLSPPVEPSFTGYETLFSVANFVNGNTNAGDVALGGGGNNNGNRASIAERRGAKCGFRLQTERINTPRFRTTSPLPSPSAAPVRSPYITIPPGISPTALLDSPIMLSNSQSSPTTGSFPLLDLKFESSLVNTVASGDGNRSSNTSLSFTFKPYRDSDSFQEFSLENQGNDLEFQDTDSMEPLMGFEYPIEFSKETSGNQCTSDSVTDVNIMTGNGNASDMQVNFSDVAIPISIQRETTHGDNAETHHHLEEYEGTLPASVGRTSEDGYNWRKYGQKRVKGSEYPRSYYKCTHPYCQVKKKIERAHDGQMTEIIYKGAHNHPKPQTSGEAPPGTSSPIDEMLEMDGGENFVKVEGGSIWKNTESGLKDIKVYSDWRADGLERTSSTSVVTELSDPLSTTLVKSLGTFGSTETPELSSTLASHEDDDGVTQRSSFGADTDDESESKRRKIERCVLETNMASRAVREPRVVVQIESPDMEILDDGYRWRKYGQKVVKGNPNPRSYYKCTSAGCSVRKHVERAAHNVKYVITTYEGKHNHEVPAARNSSHMNSTSSNVTQNTANAQPSITLARNANGPNPETQIFAPSFDKNPVFNNDYLRSHFPRNFSNEMNLGSSSVYPTKFPLLQTTVPYHFCRFNNDQLAASHSGSVASLVPDFPGSLPSSSLQTAANLSLHGVDFSSNAKRVRQVQTFLLGQQLTSPTQEQKDDSLSSSGPSVVDHLNASSSMSTVYNQLLGRF